MNRIYLILFVLLLCHTGRANLIVYPTRVFLSDEKKVANLSLRHIGPTPETYRGSLIFFRMNEEGALSLANDPKPEERPALKYIRFTPRATTLTPKKEQVLRVMVAAPRNIPDGDYRAHLHLVPDPAAETEDESKTSGRKLSMELKARMAVAIPVVYRKGNPTVEVGLQSVKLVSRKDKSAYAVIRLTAKGNAIPYGDLVALFRAPGQLEFKQIGLSKGVSFYTPAVWESIDLTSKGHPLNKGTLRLEFRESDTEEPKVLAFKEMAVR